jgi:hypothetical protein
MIGMGIPSSHSKIPRPMTGSYWFHTTTGERELKFRTQLGHSRDLRRPGFTKAPFLDGIIANVHRDKADEARTETSFAVSSF